MGQLNLNPNFANADDFYEILITAHEGLSKIESDALNARLIILLSNHIGDLAVLERAITLARQTTIK